jgi:hypothetical protein
VVAIGRSGWTSAPNAPVDRSCKSKGFAAPTDASRVKHGGPRMPLLLLGWARDAVDLQAVNLCSLKVAVAALRCSVPEDRVSTCIVLPEDRVRTCIVLCSVSPVPADADQSTDQTVEGPRHTANLIMFKL